MDQPPLSKPAHLQPADSQRGWLAVRPAAVAAAVLGALAFLVALIAQPEIGATPDWRITVPGFAVTAIASIISIARRERGGYPLWLIGVGLAAAALVLGWFLMLSIVVAVTVLAIVILHSIL
ncbi:MAG: hypothetical protein AB7O24_12690 [Kofleriaceae bacterium]